MGRMSFPRFICSGVFALMILFASVNVFAAEYEIQDIGSLGGNWIDGIGTSYADALNEPGQVAGRYPSIGYRAFAVTPEDLDIDGIADNWINYSDIYMNNSLMDNIGKLPAINGVHAVGGINDSGTVVGWSEYTSPGPIHGFVAEETAGSWSIQDVNTLFPSAQWNLETTEGINNADVLAGTGKYDSDQDGSLESTRGYVIDSGVTTAIDPIPANPGDIYDLDDHTTKAHAVNNLGQVVGESIGAYNHLGMYPAGAYSQGFLYDDGTVIPLGHVGYNVASFGLVPLDINENGQIVGHAKKFPLALNHTATLAFLLNPLDTDSDGIPDTWYRDDNSDYANDLIQPLYGSGTYGALLDGIGSVAYGINNSGYVVGTSSTLSNGTGKHAFVWDGSGYIQDLNDLIDDPRWLLYEARGINDAGWIVGWGRYEIQDGVYRNRGYILAPTDTFYIPEPATLFLFGGALAGIGLLRRKRTQRSVS